MNNNIPPTATKDDKVHVDLTGTETESTPANNQGQQQFGSTNNHGVPPFGANYSNQVPNPAQMMQMQMWYQTMMGQMSMGNYQGQYGQPPVPPVTNPYSTPPVTQGGGFERRNYSGVRGGGRGGRGMNRPSPHHANESRPSMKVIEIEELFKKHGISKATLNGI